MLAPYYRVKYVVKFPSEIIPSIPSNGTGGIDLKGTLEDGVGSMVGMEGGS